MKFDDGIMRRRVLYSLHRMGKLQSIIQDTHGNLSARAGDVMYIKPSGVRYELIGLEDVCRVSLDRQKDDENRLKPSVDTPHHRTIYKNNPHVGAICHTHSPHCVAAAVRQQGLQCYTTEQADYFGGDVEVLPYADFNSWGDITLKDGERAVLLANHGALTFGRTPEEAVDLAVALENVARKNYLVDSLQSGFDFDPLLEDEQKKWHERYMNVYGQKNDTDS